jgi:hypothetical protein
MAHEAWIAILRSSPATEAYGLGLMHSCQMKLAIRMLTGALLFFAPAGVESSSKDVAPPQRQLKTYALHNSPHSADMSPDEQLVVTESTIQQSTGDAGTKTFHEVVQLWNFKEDKLIAEFPTQRAEVKASTGGYFRDPVRDPRFVRFSTDGGAVVALVDRTIHVFRAGDLTELRALRLAAPDDATRTVGGNAFAVTPNASAMEISPSGDSVAVLWSRDMEYSEVRLYALDSGRIIQSWKTPERWLGFFRTLVWQPDGKGLLIGIQMLWSCMPSGCPPDIYTLNVQSGEIRPKLTTGLLAGSIAVTADNRLLVADSNRLGILANRNPKLKVFDLLTGKLLRQISGRGTGVRYVVSVSGDGSRFLAFTGRMKPKIDWSDLVAWDDEAVDETFSVWSLKDYAGILTSQMIPGLRFSRLRLSAQGRYAFSYGRASFVYELP